MNTATTTAPIYKRLKPLDFLQYSQPSQTFEMYVDGTKFRTYKAGPIDARQFDLAQIDQVMATRDLVFVYTDQSSASVTRIWTQSAGYRPKTASPVRTNIAGPATAQASAASHKFKDPKLNSALALMQFDQQTHKEILQMAAQDEREYTSKQPPKPKPKKANTDNLDPLINALLAHDAAGKRRRGR